MAESISTCGDCGGILRPIRVVEQDHRAHHLLKYSAVNAKPDWFFGAYPVEGHLAAEMCESCGRVVFRAVPKSAGTE